LRIRPLLKKEKDDAIILEPANSNKRKNNNMQVAVLHPSMAHLSSPQQQLQRTSGNLSSPKFIQQGKCEEFHFDQIFDSSCTQDDVYYSMGLNMATQAMEPLTKKSATIHNHVALVMGVAHAGKTFSALGEMDKLSRSHRQEQDGLVPRIVESLYSQSKHFVSSKKSFAVRIMLVQVEQDVVHDLLHDISNGNSETPPSSRKKSGVMAMVASFEGSGTKNVKEVVMEQDTTTLEYVPDATVKTCWSASEARQVLHQGLSRGLSSKFAGLGKGHSRGHTLITMQPVIIRGSRRDSTAVDKCGGTITFLDMAASDSRVGARKSRATTSGGTVRDAIADNSCFSAVQHVLRTIKHNQEVLSGKVSPEVVDCGDEDTFDGSELSNVSEPKVSKNTAASIKPVPYRQSKVTMLLQPHFTNAGQWNLDRKKTSTFVTTLMTTYPGHRDYAEKRSLLNDLELLLGSDIAKRMKHDVNTGLDTGTPKHVKSKTTTLDDTSEETSSLEMSDDDDGGLVPQQRVEQPVQAAVPFAPSYEEDDDVDDVMPEPLPPPYAPGSQASLLHAQVSAPPIEQVYDAGVGASSILDVTTEMQLSPAVPDPPSSQRRKHVVDLPGVTIPPRMSASPYLSCSTPRRAPTPPSVNRTPSTNYKSPPLVDANRNKPLVAMASISSQPNIQPPRSINKENSPSTTTHRDSPPSRNWKETSPMKTISRAVHSSKKHGRKAMDKMDKIMDRTVTKRMSSEFEPEPEASTSALLHRVKVLEKQNAKLTETNEALTEKCEQLTNENERLRRSVNSSKMQWRRDCWTEQDEEDWKRSLRIRREQQDLIKSPLREHLENVHESYETCNQWMRANKVPFSLQFPSHWQRATALDERDRALQPGVTAPPSTPDIPGASVYAPRSNQKRTQFSAFKKRLDALNNENKRYKRGERTPQY
jgi:hypothetical protein